MSLIQPLLNQIQDSVQALLMSLGERFAPLIENLRPIWTDPLWQFIGLILLLTLLVILLIWLLKAGSDVVVSVSDITIKLFNWPLKAVRKAFQALSQKRQQQQDEEQQPTGWQVLNRIRVRQGMDVVRYLTTRRDWRYQTPWYLLAGVDSSGKSSWVQSVRSGVRAQLLAREKQLAAAGSQWHFFDQGVIIEVEQEKHFTQTVDLLNFYRPERPVDGLILTISAKALQQASDPVARRTLGEALYRQLWSIQKQTCFVVPVYVQVTQCDHVRGFNEFWSAGTKERPQEMFGWSNPTRLDAAFSPQWVDDAFTSVVDGIRRAQLQLAAGGDGIAGIDAFMLFDLEFQNLAEPLREVLAFAFARSSYQEAPPLRGIWFSGKVRDEVALTDDFLNHKLWPETLLAYPAEQRRFSTNRTLRHAQYATLAIAFTLLSALLIDSTRLYHYSVSTEKSWADILKKEPDCSESGSNTWWLLSSLSKMSEQPLTLSLPASWGSGQMRSLKAAVAQRIYPNLLFQGMDCRLQEKATELKKDSVSADDDLETASRELKTFMTDLREYQQAQKRLIYLAGPLPDNQGVAGEFQALLDYLYNSSIPSTITFDSPLLAGAIVDTAYDINWNEHDLVDPEQQLTRLNTLSNNVRKMIGQQATRPPVAAIQRAFLVSTQSQSSAVYLQKNAAAMTGSLQDFQRWLLYMKHQWIDTRAATSPCGRLQQEMASLRTVLLDAGYPDTIEDAFSNKECDEAIRNQIAALDIAPLGKLFQLTDDGPLDFSPQMEHWEEEFAALRSLSVVSQSIPTIAGEQDSGDNSGAVVAWNAQPLEQALDMLLSYQAYTQQWWPVVAGKQQQPFYATALRSQLQQTIRKLIARAQIHPHDFSRGPLSGATDSETELGRTLTSFSQAEGYIRQLLTLLQQEQDSGNVALLQNASRRFISDQLQILNNLVAQNRLYLPLKNPQWASDSFAAALFSYTDPADLDGYLQSQRLRVEYLAQNYARPLLSFLLDTDGVANTDRAASLWLGTLSDLQRYQRKDPGNQIASLENFIATQLPQLDAEGCNNWLTTPAFSHTSAGLFARRQYEIDNQLRSYCEQYGKNTVIKRYLALAQRFNAELAGHFPFAPADQAGHSDIDPGVVQAFFADYRKIWGQPKKDKPLATGLAELIDAQPELALDPWLEFVSSLDQLAALWDVAQDADGVMNLDLQVEFAALPEQSLGTRQIIQWTLSSGHDAVIYPNGNNRLSWKPDNRLALTLRWATGSEYSPVRNTDLPLSIDSANRSATFSSEGRWAMFEWLQRFSGESAPIAQRTLLSFRVPVAARQKVTAASAAAADNSKPASYTSKVHLLLNVSARSADGTSHALLLPALLPQRAPGLPGSRGGNDTKVLSARASGGHKPT